MWKVMRLFGLCTALLGISVVRDVCAEGHHGPIWADCCDLEADWDWFEPIYCDCPDDAYRNEGIFFSYERMNWNVLSSPRYAVGNPGLQVNSSVLLYNDPIVYPGGEQPPPPTPVTNGIDVSQPDSNFGWGNRYQFGYMVDHVGWDVGVLGNYITGDSRTYGVENTDPNSETFTGTVAVMFQFPAGLFDGFVDFNNDGTADDVDSDGNNAFGQPADFGDLVAFVPSFDTLTINHQTRMIGVEVMRTIQRNDFYARNTTVEFLYGLRFLRIDNSMSALGLGSILADSNWTSEVENKMFGPQVALRLGATKGRWSVRTQGRFMAALNVRDASLEGTMGSLLQPLRVNNPLYFNPTSFAQYDSDIQFSPLGEIRLDAVFHVTKKFAVNVGYTGTYATNIGYGDNMVAYTLPSLTLRQLADLDTQHFFSNGINFGFEINR